MIRLEETGVSAGIHNTVLAYEVALLEEHVASLSNSKGFSAQVCKAVQSYLMDRMEIIEQEEE